MTDEPSPTFGQLLRQGRLAAGLSQAALAARAGLSERAIGALEGGERRAPYPATVGRLARALRLPPADRARLQAAVAPRHAAARPAPGRSRGPAGPPAALTSFVGRERELAELAGLLPTARLLTLTGAGGVGKTRLALELARAAWPDFPDGVRLVELAALADPALVPNAVAAALGVTEQSGRPLTETLAGWLAERHLLLVLDNCEHLLDGCAALVDALLRGCPGLRVLATSREPLGIAGETAWPTPPLTLPDLRSLPPADDLADYEAIRLFLDRATAARPDFRLTPANAAAVAALCVRLDGLPLAIELAAARVRGLPPAELMTHLDRRFHLLTGGSRTALPRHRTLRAAIDWSYDLLTTDERQLLRRLSVFAGGASIAAIETVCAGDGLDLTAILPGLLRLVEQSLVLVDHRSGDEARYRLLETVRQYAAERLAEAGDELESARDRHLAWCLALAEQSERELRGPRMAAALDRLEREHDNLRAALGWCLASGQGSGPDEIGGRIATGLRLAAALGWFWHLRTHWREGVGWLEQLLARRPRPATAAQARALFWAASIRHVQLGDIERGQALYDECIALARALGERAVLAHALGQLGQHYRRMRLDYAGGTAHLAESRRLARALGDQWLLALSLVGEANSADFTRPAEVARARAAAEEGLALYQAIGAPHGVAGGQLALGRALLAQGDYPRAREAFTAQLAAMRALRETGGVGNALSHLGAVALARGRLAEAAAHFRECLGLFWGDAVSMQLIICLEGLAGVAVGRDQAARAARLLGAAHGLGQAHGRPRLTFLQPLSEATIRDVRAALGGVAFAAAWAAGQALTPEQAVAEALAAAEAPPSPGAPPARSRLPTDGPEHLTAREAEIASLMARGLSNRELADELAISERTVERHLTNIRAKLGVTGRVQVATWALARELGAAAPRP